MRRSWRAGGLVATCVLVLSACWPTPGGNSDRRSANDAEEVLTDANVATLEQAFRVALPVDDVQDPDEAAPVARPEPKAPVVTGRGLFVSSAFDVHAFDRLTGEERWRTRVGRIDEPPDFPDQARWISIGAPFVRDDVGQVLVTDESARRGPSAIIVDRRLSVLDTATGTVVEHDTDAGMLHALRGSLVAEVHTAITRPYRQSSATVRDLVDGSVEIDGTLSSVEPQLTLGHDALWPVSGARVEALPFGTSCPTNPGAAPCAVAWEATLDGDAHPVVVGQDGVHLYAATEAGTLHALDRATGEVRWAAPLGSPATAPPAHADGLLHVPTEAGELVTVAADGCGAATCDPLWRGTTGAGAMTVQPAVAGGVVYTGSADGSVHAFPAAGCSEATCDAAWTDQPFDRPVDSGLAVALGHLYVGATDGVVAYRPAAGPPGS